MDGIGVEAGVRVIRPTYSRWIRWSAFAVVLAALVVWPLIRLQAFSLSEGLGAFRRVLGAPGMGRVLINTVALGVGCMVLAVLLGTALAWCVYRSPVRIRGWLGLLPVIPLMVPAVASISGYVFLFAPRVGLGNRWLRELGIGSGTSGPVDVYSMPGIIAITGFSLTSFVFLFVNASLQQRGSELEIAATACGASPARVFWTVTLPLLRPAITYSAGITFLLGVGQFAAPLLLGAPRDIDVVTTVIFDTSQHYPIDYAFGAVLGTPLLLGSIVIVVLQRWSLRDERRYVSVAGKGRYVSQRATWWAVVPVLAYVAVTVLLPISALVLGSLAPYWSGRVDPAAFTLDAFRRTFEDPSAVAAVSTTVQAAVITLVIVLPIGFLAAVALVRRTAVPGPIRWAIDVMASLSVGLPAALLGFALLLAYTGAPLSLYGTTAIIVVAYVTLMLPHAIRPQLSSLLATSSEYVEASMVSGSGGFRTAVRITVPLVRTGVGVAVAMVVVLVFHEFAASVLVRSPQTQVMGTLLFDQWTSGTTSGVAVVSLLMVAVTTVGVGLALLIGGRQALNRM